MDNNNELRRIATEIRKHVVQMVYKAKSSHVGCCLSIVDLLTVLYFRILNIDPKSPMSDERDRFILSKGHAVAALYATLAKKGFAPIEVLKSYCADGSILAGHSTLNAMPGVEASTGSEGHGLSIAVGMALAAKHDKKPYKAFVIVGDGECNEGSIWEAVLFAAQHKLDNLTVIVDYNKIQGMGFTKGIIELEPLDKKWESFGWSARIIDGHDFDQIEYSLKSVPFEKNKPSVIIANTIKGKGISYMENRYEWHYKSPNDEQLKIALQELDNYEKHIS